MNSPPRLPVQRTNSDRQRIRCRRLPQSRHLGGCVGLVDSEADSDESRSISTSHGDTGVDRRRRRLHAERESRLAPETVSPNVDKPAEKWPGAADAAAIEVRF